LLLTNFARAACCLFAVTVSSAQAAENRGQTPPGITVKVTGYGPIFTSASGATLYTRDDDTPGISRCNNVQLTEYRTSGSNNFPMPAPEIKKTCQEKMPPVLASSSSQPFGEWSIIKRDDGTRQWAYKGNALYSSAAHAFVVSDGNERRGFRLAVAPKSFIGVPDEFGFEKTNIGLALADAGGRTIYAFKNSKTVCQGICQQKWRSVPAPLAAKKAAGHDWSAVERESSRKVWLYKGKALYTFSGDEEPGDVNGNGVDGAEAVLLWKLPTPPGEISVQETLLGKVYADSQGRTAYFLYCSQPSADHTSCDEPGDLDIFVKSMCGGEKGRCTDLFKPIVAPPGAASRDPQMWSVVKIDPEHPTHVVADGAGVSVWAYEGMPLWTFVGDSKRVGDERPGDIEGIKPLYFPFGIIKWNFAQFYGNRTRRGAFP
jgi:predicted lipoprotein with Yx(FWY)xxD motif